MWIHFASQAGAFTVDEGVSTGGPLGPFGAPLAGPLSDAQGQTQVHTTSFASRAGLDRGLLPCGEEGGRRPDEGGIAALRDAL